MDIKMSFKEKVLRTLAAFKTFTVAAPSQCKYARRVLCILVLFSSILSVAKDKVT
jgi:hypothetical protein